MKKIVFGVALISIFFLLVFAQEDEECLKIEASVHPRWLSRGQEGNVILKIKLANGITVSPQPSFIIECSPSQELIFPKNFFTASDLEIEIKDENGEEYLNLEKPIEIPFTVRLEAKRGNHSIGGKIKYFAFSREEGWCLKSTVKFSASFYTRSTRVKKEGREQVTGIENGWDSRSQPALIDIPVQGFLESISKAGRWRISK